MVRKAQWQETLKEYLPTGTAQYCGRSPNHPRFLLSGHPVLPEASAASRRHSGTWRSERARGSMLILYRYYSEVLAIDSERLVYEKGSHRL